MESPFKLDTLHIDLADPERPVVGELADTADTSVQKMRVQIRVSGPQGHKAKEAALRMLEGAIRLHREAIATN